MNTKQKILIGLPIYWFAFALILIFLTGCSNTRIIYPNESYNEVKQSLPDNVRLVEYQKGELMQGRVVWDKQADIYTIHCEIWSDQCIRHELWHVNNWDKTHDDMPRHLLDVWNVGG